MKNVNKLIVEDLIIQVSRIRKELRETTEEVLRAVGMNDNDYKNNSIEIQPEENRSMQGL